MVEENGIFKTTVRRPTDFWRLDGEKNRFSFYIYIFTCQDYQSSNIRVATDLSVVKSCETLEDQQEPDHFGPGKLNCNNDGEDIYLAKPDYSQPALASPPVPEAIFVQEESAYKEAPPERVLEKPKLELRTFFPKTWLFELEFTNDTSLSR